MVNVEAERNSQSGEEFKVRIDYDPRVPYEALEFRLAQGESAGLYKPTKVLGEGSFGAVLEAAKIDGPGENIAVKVLKPDVNHEDVRKSFCLEEIFMKQIRHPNVVGLLGSGRTVFEECRSEYSGTYTCFIAMPLYGQCLKSISREKSWFSYGEVLTIAGQIFSGLGDIHSRGIIHRDIKLSNILQGNNSYKISDFGSACRECDADAEPGRIIGTPEFMSPEQLAGQTCKQSDLYSVGIIMYRLLTGQLPHSPRNRMQMIYQKVMEPEGVSMRERGHNVPLAIEHIIKRSTEDADKRYQNADEALIDVFEAWQDLKI